ncbi:hypothetical protein QFZ58_002056 [Streptomyces sp. B1I3]|nr:hypothetical protein [Streptomyces sp. B1I3]
MKAEYEKHECQCGWFCLTLKTAKATAYHCGEQLKKTAGSVKESK